MSPRRLNATPNIKKTGVSIGAAVLARSAGKKENAQRPTSNAQRPSQTKKSVDTIVQVVITFLAEKTSAEEIGGPKIDIAGLLTARLMPVRIAPQTGR